MYDRYEIVGGVFNPDYEENIKFAKQIGVNTDRVYKDFDEFVAVESAKPEERKGRSRFRIDPQLFALPHGQKACWSMDSM